MTTVAILPVPTEGGTTYRAVSAEHQTDGRTAGEALDAIVAQLSEDEKGTLVVVQNHRPDKFFAADQQQRLAELMERWRAARNLGPSLSDDEQAELEALVQAELEAATARAEAIALEVGP